jgi:hypothetical protein
MTKYKQKEDIKTEQSTWTGWVTLRALVAILLGSFDDEMRTGANDNATAALVRRNTSIRAE